MPIRPDTSSPATPKSVVLDLHALCTAALEQSTAAAYEPLVGHAHVFVTDLEAWAEALAGRPEAWLVNTASHEYALSVLACYQGQYRNGFKGLRLVLELCLQASYLSADLLALSEWMKNDSDTVWATILEGDRALFSKKFCAAFAPELVSHVPHFKEIARTLYRELSECIHGNVPYKIPLPLSLAFDEATFRLWHEKRQAVRLVSTFVFTMRYLGSLAPDARKLVEAGVVDQLGHIESIRNSFVEQ